VVGAAGFPLARVDEDGSPSCTVTGDWAAAFVTEPGPD
jgi:hypothetical protein